MIQSEIPGDAGRGIRENCRSLTYDVAIGSTIGQAACGIGLIILADHADTYICGWEGCSRGPLSFGSPGCIFFAIIPPMHLLYLDDSGSANNPDEEYLVLG